MEERIILRHLRDGEAKIDEFPVDTLIELTFGRDPSCQIHEPSQFPERRLPALY